MDENKPYTEYKTGGDGISPAISAAIAEAIGRDASDLHLKTGQTPAIRFNGTVIKLGLPVLTEAEIIAFTRAACPGGTFDPHSLPAIDFSWVCDGQRFRCNVFRDMNGACVSMRLLTIKTTDFAALGIPEILKKLSRRKSGLLLVTGPTGSGKTTTLTCLVDYLNQNYPSHIIMLEDPIEYVHVPKKCIISQREIGINSQGYDESIVEALREDPDIILIGEMRDMESISGALRAAETGHLVLSTLHTKGAANTVTRIVDVFPPEQQNQVRMQLSMCLLGVISQQLLPRIDRVGRVLATEVMVCTLPMQNLIRQQKVHMMNSTIELSSSEGMYTMKHSLEELLKRGIISRESYNNYQIV